MAETLLVATLNAAEVCPAATETFAGTVAAEALLLVSVTAAPPVGAAALSVTVADTDVPPVTEVGLRETRVMEVVVVFPPGVPE